MLEDFYKNLDRESFQANEFAPKNNLVGEPDSLSDESSNNENNKEETEKCV